MRVEHMREFVAIRDEGNFSRAARSLFMTQPALSRHVQEMERELGVRLFDRDRHSVTLTEAGERAYKAFCDAGLHDVFMRLYPGGRHEMLNETNKEQVYQDILNWLNEKI